jgi:predicted enzyme related to lactoylglutathione lyase
MWHFQEDIVQTTINWFEIPSTDFPRAVRFYEAVFDTKLKVEPFGSCELGIFAGANGDSVGCVIRGEGYSPSTDGAVLYLDGGASIDKVLARIEPAGGSIKLPKLALPSDMGFIAHFIDTEGNRLALHAMA